MSQNISSLIRNILPTNYTVYLDQKYVLTSLLQDSSPVAILKNKISRHVTQHIDVKRLRTDSPKNFRTDDY